MAKKFGAFQMARIFGVFLTKFFVCFGAHSCIVIACAYMCVVVVYVYVSVYVYMCVRTDLEPSLEPK